MFNIIGYLNELLWYCEVMVHLFMHSLKKKTLTCPHEWYYMVWICPKIWCFVFSAKGWIALWRARRSFESCPGWRTTGQTTLCLGSPKSPNTAWSAWRTATQTSTSRTEGPPSGTMCQRWSHAGWLNNHPLMDQLLCSLFQSWNGLLFQSTSLPAWTLGSIVTVCHLFCMLLWFLSSFDVRGGRRVEGWQLDL